MAERWTLKVRDGAAVRRSVHGSLADALDELQAETAAAATRPQASAVEMRVRRFEPADRVVLRGEVRGPQRFLPSTACGIDVRGDNSIDPWVGSRSRRLVAVGRRETAWQALRRELGLD